MPSMPSSFLKSPSKKEKKESWVRNSPWAFDYSIKPPFTKGMVVIVKDTGIHVPKGTPVKVDKVQKTGGDWFLYVEYKCGTCEEKGGKSCGGWYAYHFTYPEVANVK